VRIIHLDLKKKRKKPFSFLSPPSPPLSAEPPPHPHARPSWPAGPASLPPLSLPAVGPAPASRPSWPCGLARPSRSPAPHAAPSARAVGNRRRLPRGPHLSGPSPAQTHLSLVPCSPPLPCPARPARPRCSPPPSARAVWPRPRSPPVLDPVSPWRGGRGAPSPACSPARPWRGGPARLAPPGAASPPTPRPVPVPVPPVVCPARSAHDPVPGARRRSLGSVCGHGGHGARARPRLPFPVSRPAGPRHARARPSSAAFARPGVQPPPRGSASSRPARSHPPLPGELARLAARRSVAMAWPQWCARCPR
jgi:hypothetical protein